MKKAALVMLGLLLGPFTGVSRSDDVMVGWKEFQAESLRGLSGVEVGVPLIHGLRAGLADSSSLGTHMELRLRGGGVHVMWPTEASKDLRHPHLSLQIIAVPMYKTANLYAIYASLELSQLLWINKEGRPVARALGTTWSREEMFASADELLLDGDLVKHVDGFVDEFLNSWLATHPVPTKAR